MRTGERIQALRTEKHMTQEQLAEKLFVSRELVSKWELGQRKPDIRMLREMARLFSVEIESLTDTQSIAEELAPCVPTGKQIDAETLKDLLIPFLDTLSVRDRVVFLRRYYYLDDASEIALIFDIKENYARSILARTRKKLKKYLKGMMEE